MELQIKDTTICISHKRQNLNCKAQQIQALKEKKKKKRINSPVLETCPSQDNQEVSKEQSWHKS